MTACFLFSELFWNISEEIVWKVGISWEIWEMNAFWKIAFLGIISLGINFPGNVAFENDSLGNKFPGK